MTRLRGKNIRLEDMKIRRSPRIKRALVPPEKKRIITGKYAKRGRKPTQSRVNKEVSNEVSVAVEVQVPESTQPNDTTEKQPVMGAQRKLGKERENTQNAEDDGEKAVKEEKPTATPDSKFSMFQHPKYEGCMWIKGSLAPPYSGVRRWTSLEDGAIEPQLDKYEAEIAEWAAEYALESGELFDSNLSEQDKQAIVDSLGCYCAFKDWYGLVEGLLPKQQGAEVSMPVSPNTSMESQINAEEEDAVELVVQGYPNPAPMSLLDRSVENASEVKNEDIPEVSMSDIPEEPKENASRLELNSQEDIQAESASRAPSESPLKNQTSSDVPPRSPDTTPSSSPEEPLTSPKGSLPSSAPRKELPSPPGLPKLLVECFLSRHLYKTIIQDPFYYLVKAEDKEIESVPTAFGRDFYHLWEKLMKASRVKAQRVRMEITQLLNGFDLWDQCHDIAIGAESRTLRKLAVERLVASLLSESSVLIPLLRPLDDRKKLESRTKRLVNTFREAAEIAIWMYTQESYFLFGDEIVKLGPFDGQITGSENILELGFKEAEDTMKPHGWTRTEYPEGVLNGRLPVLMTRPVLRRVFVDSWTSCAVNDRPGKVVSRASVVLGNEEPLDRNRTKW